MRRSTISSTAALLGAQSRTRVLVGMMCICWPGMEIDVAPGLAFPVRKAPTIPRMVFVLPMFKLDVTGGTCSWRTLN